MKEIKEMKKLGRPVDVNSKRQIELKMKEELRSKGLIKRGRPVVEGSKNQLKQERKQVLAEQGLLTGERGRPVNPNNFKVDLKKVDCDVYIDNRYLGKYALDTLMHIPKKQNFELPSRMRVSMGGVFKNAFSLLMNKEVLIKVKGKTKIGKGSIFFDVPFTYETKQTISL